MCYSQTCIRRPLMGPLKSGGLRQAVVLQNTSTKRPLSKCGHSWQVFSFFPHVKICLNKDLLISICNKVFLFVPQNKIYIIIKKLNVLYDWGDVLWISFTCLLDSTASFFSCKKISIINVQIGSKQALGNYVWSISRTQSRVYGGAFLWK